MVIASVSDRDELLRLRFDALMKEGTTPMAEYSYTVLFEPAEEGGFVVTCPALPGLVTEHVGGGSRHGPRCDSGLYREPVKVSFPFLQIRHR